MAAVSGQVIAGFRRAWDPFPEPVLLLDGRRRVLAVNEMGQRFAIQPGCRCGGLGTAEPDSANDPLYRAIRSRGSMVEVVGPSDNPVFSCWIPVEGSGDLVVHLGLGVVWAALCSTTET